MHQSRSVFTSSASPSDVSFPWHIENHVLQSNRYQKFGTPEKHIYTTCKDNVSKSDMIEKTLQTCLYMHYDEDNLAHFPRLAMSWSIGFGET